MLRWEILEELQPWGQKRDDYRSAVICWTIASINYAGKGRRPQLKDFLKLFDFEPKEKAQTDEQIMRIFKRIGGTGKK